MDREKEGRITVPDNLNTFYPWPPTIPLTLIRVTPREDTREIAVSREGDIVHTVPTDPITKQFLADMVTLTDAAVKKRRIPTLTFDKIAEQMDKRGSPNLLHETVVSMTEQGLVTPVDEDTIILATSPLALVRALENEQSGVLKIEPKWWQKIDPPLLNNTDVLLLRWLEQKIKARVADSKELATDQLIAISLEGLTRYMDQDILMQKIKRLAAYGFYIRNEHELLVGQAERENLAIFFHITSQELVPSPQKPPERENIPKTGLVREPIKPDEIIIAGANELVVTSRVLTIEDITIRLTRSEMDIMIHFLLNPNVYFHASEVAKSVYGSNKKHFQENVWVHIFALRSKVATENPDIQLIHSHSQRGYMLKVPELTTRENSIQRGTSTLDSATGAFTDNEQTANLSILETTILEIIMSSDRPLSTHELAEKVYHRSVKKTRATILTHIKNIRHKIEKDPKKPQRLRTKEGGGYYFSEEEDE